MKKRKPNLRRTLLRCVKSTLEDLNRRTEAQKREDWDRVFAIMFPEKDEALKREAMRN